MPLDGAGAHGRSADRELEPIHKSEIAMNKMLKRVALTGAVTLLCLNVSQALAQQGGGGGGMGGGGRGNFDPEQMRQRMMERYKEAFGITDEAGWKIIQEKITKVNEARREVGFGGGMGMMGRRQGGPGGPGGPGGDQAGAAQGGGQDRQRRPAMDQNPEAEALQKAIEAKASDDELTKKMTAYRDSRKAKQAKLTAAQEDLRGLLTVRQQAVALQMGLVD
jgi:hypothetical protein